MAGFADEARLLKVKGKFLESEGFRRWAHIVKKKSACAAALPADLAKRVMVQEV